MKVVLVRASGTTSNSCARTGGEPTGKTDIAVYTWGENYRQSNELKELEFKFCHLNGQYSASN